MELDLLVVVVVSVDEMVDMWLVHMVDNGIVLSLVAVVVDQERLDAVNYI